MVGLLIVALPLSATASFAAGLTCPHQGLGAAAAHDHAAMMGHERSTGHMSMVPHDHAAMVHAPSSSNDAHSSGHHACDCVHHCAGANPASGVPVLALDAVAGLAAAPDVYRSLHSDSAELQLLRPPISTAA